MSELTGPVTSPLMTQVIGSAHGGKTGDELLGEFESSGMTVGWNRATLSTAARDALHAILERNGGVLNRAFELRQGPLVLLRCRMLGNHNPSQLTFDGSQRPAIT
jgi:hypothetical protein